MAATNRSAIATNNNAVAMLMALSSQDGLVPTHSFIDRKTFAWS